MAKFKHKYRIESTRAQWWDYGWNGSYFITICTKNRKHFFGKIKNAQFIPSPAGQLAENIWLDIPEKFPYANLDEFQVMPNHIHGIIILDNNQPPQESNPSPQESIPPPQESIPSPQESIPSPPESNPSPQKFIPPPQESNPPPQESIPPPQGGFAGGKNPMVNENISRILRWYKGRCSYEIHKTNAEFAWQSRFHDHIIRNELEYRRIVNYIINNPANWEEDEFSKDTDS